MNTVTFQLIDVASGLKFLHRVNLVHGNIRGVRLGVTVASGDTPLRTLQSNILISDGPKALLGDYGLNTIIFDPFSLNRGSINWTAPELLTPDTTPYQPSIPSDVYALAMVIYEVSFNSLIETKVSEGS